jgi:hypothetical protein
MFTHTGQTVFVNIDGLSASLPVPFDIVVDLSKADLGVSYPSAPDNWFVSESNNNVVCSVTNVSHGYTVTITCTGFNTPSTGFQAHFDFVPRWNLPF